VGESGWREGRGEIGAKERRGKRGEAGLDEERGRYSSKIK